MSERNTVDVCDKHEVRFFSGNGCDICRLEQKGYDAGFAAGRLAGLQEAKAAMCKGCACKTDVRLYSFGPNAADITELWHVDQAGCKWLKCSARAIREIAQEGK